MPAPSRTLVSTAQLEALIAAQASGGDPIVVIDCRFDLADPGPGRREFAEGHVPGAAYASLDEDLAAPPSVAGGRHPLPDAHAFAGRMTAWGIAPGVQVVAYDEGPGAYAARLWWMLRHAGHDAVAVLDGGFAAWKREGRRVQAGEVGNAASAGNMAAAGPVGAVAAAEHAVARAVTTAEVAARGPGAVLIDARSPERFRGEVEPIDRVAGHVPGAVNRHYMTNLTADGTFRPAAELRAEFQALLGGAAPANAIAMCGSGVTACHNLLAMEIAGLPGARLYVGSWSAWCGGAGERPAASG
jgi:thiosulfate/3-mercaptopyruvate sulfurtransferase